MKKICLFLSLFIVILTLAACTSTDNNASQNGQAGNGEQAKSVVVDIPLLTSEEVAAQLGAKGELEVETAPAAAPVELPSVSTDEDHPVDLDLTQISGTVVYSQVYDMMMNPNSYLGQKIKMKGNFSYFQDPETKQEYFATIIADATACCAQGIEFVWKGNHAYPQDYPPLDTEITVTGTFSTYNEGGYMYVQLVDADVNW